MLDADAAVLLLGAADAADDALDMGELDMGELDPDELAVPGLLAEAETLGIATLMTCVLARGADDCTDDIVDEVRLGTALVEICVEAIVAVGVMDDCAGANELAAWVAEAIGSGSGNPCPSSVGAQLQIPIPANIERAAAVYL